MRDNTVDEYITHTMATKHEISAIVINIYLC